jgi:hypothetical protein
MKTTHRDCFGQLETRRRFMDHLLSVSVAQAVSWAPFYLQSRVQAWVAATPIVTVFLSSVERRFSAPGLSITAVAHSLGQAWPQTISEADDLTTTGPRMVKPARAYIGNPLTPMSYAGVARRTTRREERREYYYGGGSGYGDGNPYGGYPPGGGYPYGSPYH